MARNEIIRFMTADDTLLMSEVLDYEKLEDTIFINTRLNKVAFRDYNSYNYRTALTMSDKKINDLV